MHWNLAHSLQIAGQGLVSFCGHSTWKKNKHNFHQLEWNEAKEILTGASTDQSFWLVLFHDEVCKRPKQLPLINQWSVSSPAHRWTESTAVSTERFWNSAQNQMTTGPLTFSTLLQLQLILNVLAVVSDLQSSLFHREGPGFLAGFLSCPWFSYRRRAAAQSVLVTARGGSSIRSRSSNTDAGWGLSPGETS